MLKLQWEKVTKCTPARELIKKMLRGGRGQRYSFLMSVKIKKIEKKKVQRKPVGEGRTFPFPFSQFWRKEQSFWHPVCDPPYRRPKVKYFRDCTSRIERCFDRILSEKCQESDEKTLPPAIEGKKLYLRKKTHKKRLSNPFTHIHPCVKIPLFLSQNFFPASTYYTKSFSVTLSLIKEQQQRRDQVWPLSQKFNRRRFLLIRLFQSSTTYLFSKWAFVFEGPIVAFCLCFKEIFGWTFTEPSLD